MVSLRRTALTLQSELPCPSYVPIQVEIRQSWVFLTSQDGKLSGELNYAILFNSILLGPVELRQTQVLVHA